MDHPLKLVIATPSVVERSRLARIVGQCPGLTLIAQTGDLSDTYTICEAQEPDIVLLGRDYAATEEFVCMKSLFYAVRAHWIVIGDRPRAGSSQQDQPGRTPPGPIISPSMMPDELMAEIRAVLALRQRTTRPDWRAAATLAPAVLRPRTDRVILIGASTGGVDALLTVLSALPAEMPPVAIVQHTGQGFSDSLIRLLDRRTKLRVCGATDGFAMTSGVACLAAGTAAHLRLAGSPARSLKARLVRGPTVSGHLPSVDELFRSALPFASSVIAVLLTGMGRDGAEGMLALRKAGAATIAQDEASSVVYGMPRAAWEMGAAQQRLPLGQIAAEILRLSSQGVDARAGSR